MHRAAGPRGYGFSVMGLGLGLGLEAKLGELSVYELARVVEAQTGLLGFVFIEGLSLLHTQSGFHRNLDPKCKGYQQMPREGTASWPLGPPWDGRNCWSLQGWGWRLRADFSWSAEDTGHSSDSPGCRSGRTLWLGSEVRWGYHMGHRH